MAAVGAPRHPAGQKRHHQLIERHPLLVRLGRELVVQVARHPDHEAAGVARVGLVLPHVKKIL
jgi:hypothetical protein